MMHKLSPFKRVRSVWLPPMKFRLKPYLDFSRSLRQALAELEERYPSHRQIIVESRMRSRKPR